MQPLAAPFGYALIRLKRIAKYTLLMDPPVPYRYSRFDMDVRPKSRKPFFHWRFTQCLMWSYKYFFLRAPVFIAGTWLGSKLVWAIEEARGEDSMLSTKKPIMWASGFAALFVKYHRNEVIRFIRAPLYTFGTIFTVIWFADNFVLNKRGLDAFWNPLHLRLPGPVVALLNGDPFNGELVIGPLKYAAASAVNAAAVTGYSLSRGISNTADAVSNRPTGGSSALSSDRRDRMDREIASLEEQALVEQGYLTERNAQTDKDFQKLMHANSELRDEFERSAWNVFHWFSSNGDRLSQNNAELVTELFSDRRADVISPTGIAKPSTDAVFGNLSTGIHQSMDAAYVDSVRAQLQENARSSRPKPLGVAAETGFFATELVGSRQLLEHAIVDPVGWLMSPLVKLVGKISFNALPSWTPIRGFLAFDDRTDEPSPTYTSLNSPRRPGTQAIFEGENDLPGPYDLPPIVPPEAAARQAERIQGVRPYGRSPTDQVRMSAVELENTALKAGVAIANVATLAQDAVASIVSSDSSSSSSTTSMRQYANMVAAGREEMADTLSMRSSSETDYWEVLRSSVRESAQAAVEGISAEERLKNFVDNIGGRDFEEPTEGVRANKLPFSLSSRSRNLRYMVPITGERTRTYWQNTQALAKEAFETRRDFIAAAVSDNPPAGLADLRQEYEAEIAYRRAQSEMQRSRAAERLETRYLAPARKWFADFSKRWTSD